MVASSNRGFSMNSVTDTGGGSLPHPPSNRKPSEQIVTRTIFIGIGLSYESCPLFTDGCNRADDSIRRSANIVGEFAIRSSTGVDFARYCDKCDGGRARQGRRSGDQGGQYAKAHSNHYLMCMRGGLCRTVTNPGKRSRVAQFQRSCDRDHGRLRGNQRNAGTYGAGCGPAGYTLGRKSKRRRHQLI